ncbi:MAG: DUF1501 domain-containing protein [Planctomycetes bacterium]|nr:DUF1501 domain-containing protein [Planctomycetota bacterium]
MLKLTATTPPRSNSVGRRSFLKAGFLGLGGLTLPHVLRSQAAAAGQGRSVPQTSVIFLELRGGASHFETYDPKPDAPVDYRGPLGVIRTRLAGISFSETMVEQAGMMDKLAVIRSLHHESSSHMTSTHLTQTGYFLRNNQNFENEMPFAGSYAAKLQGPNAPGVVPYAAIPLTIRMGRAAYLGKAYNPFEASGDPSQPDFQVPNLTLPVGLDMQRLEDRRTLLASLDATRRLVDHRGVRDAVDHFTGQAFELVTGDRARQAFDIHREDPRLRERYGRNTLGQSLLLARRLVEAGVTFVTVRSTVGLSDHWDDHTDIAERIKRRGALYDRAVASLVCDLYERGLDRDVLVVAIGEFGRTPRVNSGGGRDHWGSVMSALVAGGGLRMGHVIGASNSRGEVPVEAPYRPEHLLAMVYRHLGIDVTQTFPDFAGRPRYILEQPKLIQELI